MDRMRQTSPLTGLPGNTTVRAALSRRVLEGGQVAAYIDIRSFKPFNDYYGFSRGDAVIRLLAGVLSRHMPSGCLAAHVGGDDFVCVGPARELRKAVEESLEEFRSRSPGFYDEADRAAGGIETLDREGSFRFFEFLDVSSVFVGPDDGSTPEELARAAGRAKKAHRGESRGTLRVSDELPQLDVLLKRISSGESPEGTRKAKALVEACGFSGDREVAGGLMEVLEGDASPDLRKSAAYALGACGAEEALPALLGALEDPSPHVRSRAVEAAAGLGGRELCPVLASMAREDPSTWVRRQALRGMGVAGCTGMRRNLLRTVMRDHPGGRGRNLVEERGAALEALAMLAPADAAPALAGLVDDPEYRPRSPAWQALLACGGEAAAGAVLRSLRAHGPEGPASGLPLRWLRLLRPQGIRPETLEALAGALVSGIHRGAAYNRERLRALESLGRLPGRDTESRLLGALAYMDGPDLELLLRALTACRVDPRPERALAVVGRIRRGGLRPTRGATLAFLRWVARSGNVNPGMLLEDFLRSGSREVRVAASRAVLGMFRLRQL
jgi:GGDEF domain-containing protein